MFLAHETTIRAELLHGFFYKSRSGKFYLGGTAVNVHFAVEKQNLYGTVKSLPPELKSQKELSDWISFNSIKFVKN